MAAQFSSTKGPRGARTRGVDRPRGQLLPGSRLAGQQDRRPRRPESVGRGDLEELAPDGGHRGRRPQKALDGGRMARSLAQIAQLPAHPVRLPGPLNDHPELVEIDRLHR